MTNASRVSSGIEGPDTLLRGGFVSNRTYVVRGLSGTGKTTVGYRFLTERIDNGENVLSATLGFDFSEVPVLDLSPTGGEFLSEESYTLLTPSEVEGQSTKSAMAEAVEKFRGEIQRAIGVLKERFGSFESTLRSFHIDSDGIHVGEPLDDLRGVLTGTPTWEGETYS